MKNLRTRPETVLLTSVALSIPIGVDDFLQQFSPLIFIQGVFIEHLPFFLNQSNQTFAGLEAVSDFVHRQKIVEVAAKLRCFGQRTVFHSAEWTLAFLFA